MSSSETCHERWPHSVSIPYIQHNVAWNNKVDSRNGVALTVVIDGLVLYDLNVVVCKMPGWT